jgi:hypothetical protein
MALASLLRTAASVLLFACLLSACIGGQTGDGPGSGDTVVEDMACRPSALTIAVDQQLPAGYSPRQLLEQVEEARVPAFVWSSEQAWRADVQRQPRGTLVPEQADAQTELQVQVRYDGQPRVALLEGACRADFVLPVTLSIDAADGSIDREVRGLLSGRPDEVTFEADSDQQVDSDPTAVSCGEGPSFVQFSRDGTPRGVVCDDEDRALAFPAACGGFAQTPLDDQTTPELPVPSEALAELPGRYATEGDDDDPLAVDLTVTAQTDLACHDQDLGGNLNWLVPVTARLEWLDAVVVFDMETLVVASQISAEGGTSDRPLEVKVSGCVELEGAALEFFGEQAGAELQRASLCFFSRRTADDVLELVLSLDGWEATREGNIETAAGWVLRAINP